MSSMDKQQAVPVKVTAQARSKALRSALTNPKSQVKITAGQKRAVAASRRSGKLAG